MARLSTYDSTKNYEKLADEYLATCGREQTKLPKISEFCREYIGANEDTVNNWLKDEAKENKELIGAIKRVKEAQSEQLQDDGLYGGKEANVAMAIFLLKANHGLIEAGRLELVGKDGQPIQFSFKIDLAGGYIPPLGAAFTASATGFTGLTPLQSPSVAQESEKDDNSTNGDNQAGSV